MRRINLTLSEYILVCIGCFVLGGNFCPCFFKRMGNLKVNGGGQYLELHLMEPAESTLKTGANPASLLNL